MNRVSLKKVLKFLRNTVVTALTMGFYTIVYADGTADSAAIGGIANNVIGNFGSLAKLITAGSFIAGFGFAVGAILKFKAHKDNPQQIPVGTPIALLFIAAALIFLPQIFTTVGHTLFGASAQVGDVTGVSSFI